MSNRTSDNKLLYPQINNEFCWWQAEEGQVNQRVIAYASYLKTRQRYFYRELQRLGFIYSERPYYQYGANKNSQTVNNIALSINASASCCDTLHSKLTKNEPSIMFLTNNADLVQQQKAENLTDFIKGEFYRSDFRQKSSEANHDALVYGTGILQIYFDPDSEQIKWERILPYDFMIDLAEADSREPRQVHKLKVVHRHSLADKFKDDPEKVKKIMSCENDSTLIQSTTRTNELVLVVESWYLASKEGEEDGRYCMTINGCDLVDNFYTHTWFPFLISRYKYDKTGFFGIGVIEETKQLQFELNYILRTIQQSSYLLAIPKVYIQENSVVASHLNNEVGTIVRYKGNPPISAPLGTVPVDLYKLAEMYKNEIFSVVGISELSSQSKKPAGLDSGKAIDTYLDVESDRFAATERAWQHMYKQAADLIINTGKDIVKDYHDYGVMSYGDKISKRIRFSDVDLEKDSYMMKDFPVSSLPDDPSEKFAYVQTLLQAQMINQQAAMELLKLPDTNYTLDIQNAQYHACFKIIGAIVENNELEDDEINFDPLIDIDMLMTHTQNAILYYRYKMKAPEEILTRLQILLEQCKRAKDIQAMQMQQQQAQIQAQAMMMAQQQMGQQDQGQQMPQQQLPQAQQQIPQQ